MHSHNIQTIQRKKGFKKAIDIDEGRRRREETTLQIRKTKKDVRLAKRRQMPVPGSAGSAMDTPAALAAASMLAAGGVAPGGYGELLYKNIILVLSNCWGLRGDCFESECYNLLLLFV